MESKVNQVIEQIKKWCNNNGYCQSGFLYGDGPAFVYRKKLFEILELLKEQQ